MIFAGEIRLFEAQEECFVKKLLLVAGRGYPANTAMSSRYHALALLFKAADCEVTLVTKGEYNAKKIKYHQGIPYISVSGKVNCKLTRAYDLLVGIPWHVKKLLQTNQYDGVLMTTRIPLLLRIMKSAERKGVRLFYDAVEWYSPSQYKKGEKAYQYRKINKLLTEEIDKRFYVISISKYFEEYFRSRGIKTVRIPAILDVQSVACEKQAPEDKTVILYAGSPGKKDYLHEILEACAQLTPEERNKLEVRLIGIKEMDLIQSCGVSEKTMCDVRQIVKCMGRRPHEEVLQNLQRAHFTVLIRPEEERYAKAGFPTKVPESLATGTPVICNLTSDLGMYLRDGKNAIVLASENVEDVVIGLRRAINLSSGEKEKMSVTARKTAEEAFDYRKYVDEVVNFLDS